MEPWHKGRRAVVDIGSNTIKVLVAQPGADGVPQIVGEKVCETRLGGGTARIEPAAFAAGVQTVSGLIVWAREQGAVEIAVVATAAVRNADNRDDFCAAIHARAGVAIRILSGEEEARLIGLGLRQDPALSERTHFLHIDLGGGSVEVIEHAGRELAQAVSLPLGAVRVTRECIVEPGRSLGRAEQERVRAHACGVLAGSGFRIPTGVTLAVLTGGGLLEASGLLTGQAVAGFSRAGLAQLAEEVAAMQLEERIAQGVSPGRADVIPAGLWVILAIVESAGIEQLRTSVYNLRRGVLAAWALGQWEVA